jgi:integrase
MPLQDVRPTTITRLYTKLRERGGRNGQPLSAGTIDHVHTVLRKAFQDSVDIEELLSRNPVERAKRPRRDSIEPGDVWTKQQLRDFLHHALQHRLGAFFHLAAYTGARRGELLFLRWGAVNLDQRESQSAALPGTSAASASRALQRQAAAAQSASMRRPAMC